MGDIQGKYARLKGLIQDGYSQIKTELLPASSENPSQVRLVFLQGNSHNGSIDLTQEQIEECLEKLDSHSVYIPGEVWDAQFSFKRK